MAATQSTTGRARRHPEIQPLNGCTPFGDIVIRITHARRGLSADGKLALLEDLQAYCARQYAEVARHTRARERRVVS